MVIMGLDYTDIFEKVPCLKKFHSYCKNDKFFFLLLIFLIGVLVIGYIVPSLFFGRPFGTDTYTHIFHAQEMYTTDSLFDFYEEIGKKVMNPDSDSNLFNYPFGSWLFIAVLAKVAGLELNFTAYIFSILFLGIAAIAYYFYSDLFLETRSQKLFALLFLFSMPNVVLSINNYRPSTFVFPFLLLAIYASYSDKMTIKNFFLMVMAVFAIALSHTGTLIYLMIFSIALFWMYCLFGRKFSRSLFALSSSTFLFFWIAVKLFPHLYQQYATKATLFLTPGNFFSNKFHIFFADDLSNVLYSNLFINHQFVYVIIWSAFIFAVGMLLVFLGEQVFQYYSKFVNERNFALIPLTGVSHSFITTPFWVGPVHVILGVIGFFRLDLKGKCLAVTVVLTTIAPAIIQSSEGIDTATGALREISYLYLIIPVVAVLGLWYIIKLLKEKYRNANALIAFIFILLFSIIIITPVIGNGYYLPSISGDDYIIEGMEWLSGTGNQNEKVLGYGYRTVPVYTEKIDASYGIASGTQTRTFIQLLKDTYLKKNGDPVMDLYSLFSTKYVLISEKLVNNLNIDEEEVVIDSQKSLDKIFSSRDFGIYAFLQQSDSYGDRDSTDERVSINTVGSNIEIKTKTYKAVIDQKTPNIKYIGDISQNCLQEGIMSEMVRISWLGDNDDVKGYTFPDEVFTREEVGNQMIYRTVLNDEKGVDAWSSVTIKYTFLPEMIKREFIISNDRLSTIDSPVMKAFFSTNIFMPASTLVLKKSQNRLEKKIYPSEDAVDINDVYDAFYFSNGDSGIYIQYGDTAPYPQYIWYKGSTVYDYSSFSIGNFEMIQPGASLHLTQYISVGSEDLAKRHIENENRISLHPYPYGITPLVLCGYDCGGNTMRYGRVDTFAIGNNSVEYTDVTGVLRLRSTLINVLNDKEKEIPYTISIAVNAPYENILYCEGLRHPQMAQYNGEMTGTVILPESEPRTQMLSSHYTKQEFFSDWKNVIRSVSTNNDMALFLMRPEDVENPIYSQDFLDIISVAEEYGLTITEPEVIASHFKNLQQITFDSFFEMDEAVITVTNNNDVPVKGVTFEVRMPRLDGDVYVADNGKIDKAVPYFSQNIVYISVDLEEHETKTISIKPGHSKKKLSVEIPDSLKEGMVTIVVRDNEGEPIENALITIDDQPYTTNEYGNVSMDLRRGSYELTVEKAGYLKETLNIDVRSYFSAIEGMIQSVFVT